MYVFCDAPKNGTEAILKFEMNYMKRMHLIYAYLIFCKNDHSLIVMRHHKKHSWVGLNNVAGRVTTLQMTSFSGGTGT